MTSLGKKCGVDLWPESLAGRHITKNLNSESFRVVGHEHLWRDREIYSPIFSPLCHPQMHFTWGHCPYFQFLMIWKGFRSSGPGISSSRSGSFILWRELEQGLEKFVIVIIGEVPLALRGKGTDIGGGCSFMTVPPSYTQPCIFLSEYLQHQAWKNMFEGGGHHSTQ